MKLAKLVAAACVCVPALCQAVAVSDVAPDFTLKTVDGANMRLKEYRGQVVLINFWASWCGPCKTMAPHFAAAARQMPEVRFVKVDSDAAPASGALHNIRSIPTLVLFKGGVEVARQSGTVPTAQLLTWVRQHAGRAG